MPMYALTAKELKGSSKQIWYEGDAAAIGKLVDKHVCWDLLTRKGPIFGYFPNPSKTWLITKEDCHTTGLSSFTGTGVKVISDSRPYIT